MRSRLLAVTPWISIAAAAFFACSSPNTGIMVVNQGSGSSSGASTTTSGSGGGGTGDVGSGAGSGGVGSGTALGSGGSGAVTTGATSGAVTTGSGAVTTGSTSGAVTTGSTSGAVTTGAGSGGASSGTGTTSGHPVVKSTGCGTAPAIATGMWVRQPANCDQGAAEKNCQAIPVGSTPVLPPAAPKSGDPEWRGWWVYLPSNYDPTKAYRVIYNGAGCFDADWFDAGNSVLPYNDVDGNDAILVGLDYDTYSDLLGCFDNRSPSSNDFKFMPWLMNTIETTYCVDTNHEFWSGYSSGGWVAQQFNCAFPDKLRGTAAVTGCEPGAAGYPGSQPPCVNKPSATFFIKDVNDTDNTYACILPACERMLTQNGCMVNGAVPKCDPMDKTITTPYTVPTGVALPAKTGANSGCVSFNGCPADYPVVFCYTTNQSHNDSTGWGGPTLLWDWFSNKLAN